MADLDALLRELTDRGGSDLYLKAGSPPHLRVGDRIEALSAPGLDAPATQQLVTALLPRGRDEELADAGEIDFAHGVAGIGRFRVHVYRQRGSFALVVRRVAQGLVSWDELGLPPVVERMALEPRGLVLVTGPAGSGKTTTVNALVDLVNENRSAHIVTIEDPIEFLHSDKRAIISQREVGADLVDVAEAVKRAARQAPDVLVVGDVRDAATLWALFAAAESANLVIAALGTSSVTETVVRSVEWFPPHEQRHARHALATNLRGVLNQRLVDRADGKGRIAAVEVLVNTPKVAECILDSGRDADLARLTAEGEYHGMQTRDQALLRLVTEGLVSLRDALGVAGHPEELRLRSQQFGLVHTR